MSCSDNVVRGGLTPKYKDVEVLCEMLHYEGGDPHLVTPTEVEPGVLLYADLAIEEFQVTHIFTPAGRQRWLLLCAGKGRSPSPVKRRCSNLASSSSWVLA